MTRAPLTLLALSIGLFTAPIVTAQSAMEIYEAVIVQYDRAASVIRIESCRGCSATPFKTSPEMTIKLDEQVIPFDPAIGFRGVADVGVDLNEKTVIWIRPSLVAGKPR